MAASHDEPGANKKQTLTVQEAKLKIAGFCAYQERSHNEVMDKLYRYGLHKNEVEGLLAWLITENYVNEERYAVTFAGGKFRLKHWGKLKIANVLQQQGISSYSIGKALDSLDSEEYRAAIRKMIVQKQGSVNAPNVYVLRHKVAQFLIGKGYEPDKVWLEVMQIITD